ncbi:MAG: GMC family oxidoreductase [Alphaproteobacteria bacterium]
MKKYHADVVIVGTGIAGAMCAYSLAKKGLRVIALDAGPRIKRHEIVSGFQSTHKLDLSAGYPNSDHAPRPDWGGEDTYLKQTGTDILRTEYLRLVGGTTWHWGGTCPRFLPVDFKMKSAYNIADDWPLSYNDLESYYAQAEKELGVSGQQTQNALQEGAGFRSTKYPMPAIAPTYSEQKIMAAIEGKSNLRFNPRPISRNSRPYKDRVQCQGFGTCSPICPSGAKYSAIVHIEQAEELGAQVLDNMLVDRIVKNKDNHITSVKGRYKAQEPFEVFGKVIVIAANGIETPRLLLMSADDHEPNGVANGSGQVGKNLMDHPGLLCRFLMPEPVYNGRGPENMVVCETYRDHEERAEKAGWMLSTNNALPLHDLTADLLNKEYVGKPLNESLKDYAERFAQFTISTEQLPHPDNSVSVDFHEKDRAGQPKIKLNYGFKSYEKKALEAMKGQFKNILKMINAELLSIGEPFSQHHLMGTTRMGHDAKRYVADSDGRSYAHSNLFFAGSSLFTTGGTANPSLTIAALALRTSDVIYAQLKA